MEGAEVDVAGSAAAETTPTTADDGAAFLRRSSSLFDDEGIGRRGGSLVFYSLFFIRCRCRECCHFFCFVTNEKVQKVASEEGNCRESEIGRTQKQEERGKEGDEKKSVVNSSLLLDCFFLNRLSFSKQVLPRISRAHDRTRRTRRCHSSSRTHFCLFSSTRIRSFFVLF